MMIRFDAVNLTFGANKIFDSLSLTFDGGKIIGVTGANGSGKSTLLKLAGKILQPDSGRVTFTDKKNNYALPSAAAVSPEMKLYDGLTAAENLKFFARLRGKILSDEEISALGQRVGLDMKIFGSERTENFSTGMRQRLKFAILLAVDADIWLLDEPTANLDDTGRENFFAEIQAAKSDKIILLATTDAQEAQICDEIIRLPI